jgi:uncharacterized membrane protein
MTGWRGVGLLIRIVLAMILLGAAAAKAVYPVGPDVDTVGGVVGVYVAGVVEVVLGLLILLPAERLAAAVPAAVVGFGALLVGMQVVVEPLFDLHSHVCGCLGSVKLQESHRLLLSGAILALGGLSLILSRPRETGQVGLTGTS